MPLPVTRLPPRLQKLHDLLLNTDWPNKEVAFHMHLSEYTCKLYSSQLYQLLGVNGRVGLMLGYIKLLQWDTYTPYSERCESD